MSYGFSVLARACNHFHLVVLEAVFLKVHSPVLCQQKEFFKVLYLVYGSGNAGSLVLPLAMCELGVGLTENRY